MYGLDKFLIDFSFQTGMVLLLELLIIQGFLDYYGDRLINVVGEELF